MGIAGMNYSLLYYIIIRETRVKYHIAVRADGKPLIVNTLSIGSDLVAAVFLCMKRGIYCTCVSNESIKSYQHYITSLQLLSTNEYCTIETEFIITQRAITIASISINHNNTSHDLIIK